MTYNSSFTGAQVDAAVDDVQEAKAASPTDTTAGRLLKVGDYGAGAAAGTTLLGTGNTPIQPNATNLILESGARLSIGTTVVTDPLLLISGSASGLTAGSSTEYARIGDTRSFRADDGLRFTAHRESTTADPLNWETQSMQIARNIDGVSEVSGLRFGDNWLALRTTGTERLRIDSSGNLLVGTTVNPIVAQDLGHRFAPEGVMTSYANSEPLELGRPTDGRFVSFYVNGVNSAGGINATQGGTPAFAAASDARLKENIADHESELNNVMSLRPVRFDWRDGRGAGEGFIAQDLECTAWADLVSEGDDGYKTVSDLGRVNTRLIKAIQEQQQIIESLTARIEALENK